MHLMRRAPPVGRHLRLDPHAEATEHFERPDEEATPPSEPCPGTLAPLVIDDPLEETSQPRASQTDFVIPEAGMTWVSPHKGYARPQ